MSKKLTQHYCKHCATTFYVRLDEDETGDFLLRCPECDWRHYRFFRDGVAIHCEIMLAGDPIEVRGKLTPNSL